MPFIFPEHIYFPSNNNVLKLFSVAEFGALVVYHFVIDTHNGGARERMRTTDSQISGALKLVYWEYVKDRESRGYARHRQTSVLCVRVWQSAH